MPDYGALVNIGAVGVVLAWFMLRAEKKLDDVVRALNRLTMAHLLEVASREDAPEIVRRQAAAIESEVRAAQGGQTGVLP